MKTTTKAQVIQKLKELEIGYKSLKITKGFIELVSTNGHTKLFALDLSRSTDWYCLKSWSVNNGFIEFLGRSGRTQLSTLDLSRSTDWRVLKSWSVKDEYVEFICKNNIYIFPLNLKFRIKSSSMEKYEICKFPELNKNEKIFSHHSADYFSSIKDLKKKITESCKGNILIISESLNSFIAEVLGFENGCAVYTPINKFTNKDFLRCKVADPYIILLKPTNKIHRKNNDFYFGFETFSGLKFFAKIDGDGEIKVSF